MIPTHFLGFDVGQAQDPSALALLELKRTPYVEGKVTKEDIRFRLIALERIPLGTLYPDVLDKVARNIARPPMTTERGELMTELVIDATGVGRPIVDMARKRNLRPIAVTITGGEVESSDDWRWRVPKRNLVMALNLVLQTDRLQFAADLDELDLLKEQMRNFKVKLSQKGHDSYEADGADEHDDLVLCLSLAVWRALKHVPNLYREMPPPPTPGEWSKLYAEKLAKKLRQVRA